MHRTYHGSCHCGAIRFEVDMDLVAGTSKCNCSICRKRRSWTAIVKPEQFRLIEGSEVLADYQFGFRTSHHRFCTRCGCAPFGDGHVPEIGGDYVSINLGSLDDAPLEALAAAPVRYSDGRNNRWREEAAEKAIL